MSDQRTVSSPHKHTFLNSLILCEHACDDGFRKQGSHDRRMLETRLEHTTNCGDRERTICAPPTNEVEIYLYAYGKSKIPFLRKFAQRDRSRGSQAMGIPRRRRSCLAAVVSAVALNPYVEPCKCMYSYCYIVRYCLITELARLAT